MLLVFTSDSQKGSQVSQGEGLLHEQSHSCQGSLVIQFRVILATHLWTLTWSSRNLEKAFFSYLNAIQRSPWATVSCSGSRPRNAQLILKDCMWTRTCLSHQYNLGQMTRPQGSSLQTEAQGQLILRGFLACHFWSMLRGSLHLGFAQLLFRRGWVTF